MSHPLVYNYCCHSPAQSFSSPSQLGLITIFYCLRFATPPIWRGRSPVFVFPRNRVAQLYPKALGSLVVSSYDSVGYGGGIRPCLHQEILHRTLEPFTLKAKFLLNDIYISSSYLTGNTLLLCYKDQMINFFRETIAVQCENHTMHINTLCGQNAVCFCVKAAGTTTGYK
jgi:hypothetical protein